jgi:hypothetical protein
VQVEHAQIAQQAKHQLQVEHAQIAQREKVQTVQVEHVLLVMLTLHLLSEGLVLLIA